MLGGQAFLIVVIWRGITEERGRRGWGSYPASVFLGLNFELYFRRGLRDNTMCDTIGSIP